MEFYGSDRDLDEYSIEEENEHPSARMRLFYILKSLEFENFDIKSHFKKYDDVWFNKVINRINQFEEMVADELFNFDRIQENERLIVNFAWNTNKIL